MNILPFFHCLSKLMPAVTIRQLQIIAAGMFCSSGRSTQLEDTPKPIENGRVTTLPSPKSEEFQNFESAMKTILSVNKKNLKK